MRPWRGSFLPLALIVTVAGESLAPPIWPRPLRALVRRPLTRTRVLHCGLTLTAKRSPAELPGSSRGAVSQAGRSQAIP